MSSSSRTNALIGSFNRSKPVVEYPRRADGRFVYPSEIFGENVFSLKMMAKSLPKPVFTAFLKQRRGRQVLDKTTADAIAHAVRVWAMDRGATHFTHWFQPQTGSTAEKHDAFLTIVGLSMPSGEEAVAIDAFSGSQLLQSEPDASSFPSGGMRTTFEARGYTIWDTSSPMFVQKGPHGTKTLYIPSCFISYNGEALDEKTILLRSTEAIARATHDLLSLIEPEVHVNHVVSTLGVEQEFFIVDRSLYTLRPDLKIAGRSLVGNLPPRHQQLEDHYFGRMPSRVLEMLSEFELEAIRLGIPVKTRHNEVGPGQFEIAPSFEESSIAVDHNLITMELLHKVSHRHGLRVLFHEKPFKGVNGSGKHCNWSLSTDRGENLLDPTVRPENNYRFLIVLLCILRGVYEYGPLLRASIACLANEHRLGAHEAPPGIISVFLGSQLNEVLDSIEENRPLKNFSVPQFQSIKVGGTKLDLKVAQLPVIARDLTDRNRTSPFAFTGNKFEFRALGSKSSPSFPVVVINCIVASAMIQMAADLKAVMGDKPRLTVDDKLKVIREWIAYTKPIRFEGNNYRQEWIDEANRRGLPNISKSPDAFAYLIKDKYKEVLTNTLHVFQPDELEARFNIMHERYVKDLIIEGTTLKEMVLQKILPAVFAYRKSLAESASSLTSLGCDASPELAVLSKISKAVVDLQENTSILGRDLVVVETQRPHDTLDNEKLSYVARELIFTAIERVRADCDYLEDQTPDSLWPFPKYTELLLTL
ncbi:Type-3 glutamine synthetase [Smittium mucronatum]|uniref:Type-3 glutamine synthetase n=1 Tax=Smittium mucronatum TaxID=133383 RepID=A0A1R0GVP2_9FUNG|nr:Type-3 glutamine synthetase [Smittium mucronatum]